MPRRKITHVIFDNDGLLLDTEPFYTQVTQKIVGEYGKTYDWSLKGKLIGRKALESARILVAELDLPIAPEEYLSRRKVMLAELFKDSPPMPFARELTQHLHRHGIPQAVATSSQAALFDIKIQKHQEWYQIFQTIVKGDDPAIRHGKPAPDLFLEAAYRMGAAPTQCLVFEDAPAGMMAAKNAGMAVIVVPDPNMDHNAYPQADQILNNLGEFKPEDWGLPAWD